VLARCGEDGQAVLGVRQIDLGQGPVQLGGASATSVRSRTASSVLRGSRRWVGVSTDTAG
jgi:hypothetical protein